MKRAERSRPASRALRSKLHYIASALMHADEEIASALVEKKNTKHLRELGALLLKVSNGKDAHRLFRQHERTKPSMVRRDKNVALAYWAAFAVDHDQRVAIAAAKKVDPTLADRTIRDIKGKHRKHALAMLNVAGQPVTFEIGDGIEVKAPSKQQYAALMSYLRKKRERPGRP